MAAVGPEIVSPEACSIAINPNAVVGSEPTLAFPAKKGVWGSTRRDQDQMLARKDQSGRLCNTVAQPCNQYPKKWFAPSFLSRFAVRPLGRDRLESMSEDPLKNHTLCRQTLRPRPATVRPDLRDLTNEPIKILLSQISDALDPRLSDRQISD